MNKKDTLDWSLIRRKIDGTLTEQEERELKEWLGKGAERQKLFDSACKYYHREELPVIDHRRIDKAWERFGKTRRLRLYRRWVSIAAVIVIALGGSFWLTFNEHETEHQHRLAAVPITPGNSKATLVLSSGEVIDLQRTDQYLEDQMVSIRLDSNGVRYESKDQVVSDAYNTIRTPQGGEYKLMLSDGTCIWLNAQTELVYPISFTGGERRVKLSGEAYFEVARNERQPFIVETDGMEVEVLGTSFNVNAYREEQDVVTTLVSGSVRIQEEGKILKTLIPSEQALWNRESANLTVRTVNTSAFIQWRTGKFVFRDHSLEEIMRTLARWYDIEYEFVSPGLKSEKFYGVIGRYEDARELLNQFEKTGKVHFEYKDHKINIKK